MADSGVDSTTVPIKTVEPEKGAPPSLAEPASGPVAEMSGALQPPAKSPSVPVSDNVTSTSTAASGVNGTTEPISALNTITKAEASPSSADQDTQAKDAPVPATEANGTPADKKSANTKRKSVGGVPEHKGKKLNKKKSIPKITHLDAQPGDYFFARLKSYPPWPSIICDEDMLPTSLLTTRPITTKQADGTYKEAYADDGKKVTERTYPVMFLYTNEFAWIPNTDLTPLDPAECKDPVPKGKSKTLLAAYEVAAEGHDLAHYKGMLADHANALQEEIDRIAAKEAEKAEKAEKKKARKSEAKAPKDDVEMVDADAEPKKGSKKRKKDADDEGEQTEKPPKTPKTTKIKLTTNKTPATGEKKTKEPKSAKPKSDKKKKGAADDDVAETVEEVKPLDPVEERKAREKEVLFLRHKLQKGFLSREQSPREDEMPQMSNYIKKLEAYPELEVAIIRTTKINKVLKALVKLNTIPRDEEFQFRKRSVDLLGKWNKILGTEPAEGSGDKDKASPSTNGVHEEKEKSEEKAAEENKNKAAQPEDKKADPASGLGAIAKDAPTSNATETSTSTSDPKAIVPVVEKAPESAAAAAQVQDIVKSTE